MRPRLPDFRMDSKSSDWCLHKRKRKEDSRFAGEDTGKKMEAETEDVQPQAKEHEDSAISSNDSPLVPSEGFWPFDFRL